MADKRHHYMTTFRVCLLFFSEVMAWCSVIVAQPTMTAYSGTTYRDTAYSGTAYIGTAYRDTSYSETAYSGTAYIGTAYNDGLLWHSLQSHNLQWHNLQWHSRSARRTTKTCQVERRVLQHTCALWPAPQSGGRWAAAKRNCTRKGGVH
jgi:hypothetical protein